MLWDLDSDSSSSRSFGPEVLVDDVQENPQLFSDEHDCSNPSNVGEIFKDLSLFIKNLNFLSAFSLNLVSSLSLFSKSINCTHQNRSKRNEI